MNYSDFEATPAYTSHVASVGVDVIFVPESSPQERLVVAISGVSANTGFARIPIGELGTANIEEFVDGEYEVSFSINGFYRPEVSDTFLPNFENYINQKFTLFFRVAEGREGAGNVLHVWTGAKLNSKSFQLGRGTAFTFGCNGVAVREYTGQQWQALKGDVS